MRRPEENIEIAGPLKKITQTQLNACKITARGEDIPKVKGQLVTIPELEGTTWRIPMDLITASPYIPRTRFRAKELRELQQAVHVKGQEKAIIVVPYVDRRSGNVRLFLQKGEPDFRVRESIPSVTVKGEIFSLNNLQELLEHTDKTLTVKKTRTAIRKVLKVAVEQVTEPLATEATAPIPRPVIKTPEIRPPPPLGKLAANPLLGNLSPPRVPSFPSPSLPNKVPIIPKKKHRGPSVFIGKQKNFPDVRGVPILTLDEKMKKGRFEGERKIVRRYAVTHIYAALSGEEVIVLSSSDLRYAELAQKLQLSAKEVIVILINKDNTVSKVHSLFLERKPIDRPIPAATPLLEQIISTPQPAEKPTVAVEEVAEVVATEATAQGFVDETLASLPIVSEVLVAESQPPAPVGPPAEQINGHVPLLVLGKDIQVGKAARERLSDMRDLRKHHLVKDDVDTYYQLLCGQEVVVLPRGYKEYGFFAQYLDMQKGEVIIVLYVSQHSTQVSKIKSNLLVESNGEST